jgi:hypothetical protein
MSFGKGSQSMTTTLTPEQKEMIKAQTGFFTETIKPTYESAVKGATDVYNTAVGGVTNAAQNAAGVSSQAQRTFGETGESALRTGISGLQNLFSPEYEARQLRSALEPAQQQYQQNIAAQGAQFGGSGQIGSARQALAGQALAGQNQALQAKTAADIENQIAQQRLAAGQSLIGAGQAGLGGAQAAASNIITAAMTPQQLYNQYSSVLFGTPGGSYNANFGGTQGRETSGYNIGGSLSLK